MNVCGETTIVVPPTPACEQGGIVINGYKVKSLAHHFVTKFSVVYVQLTKV